MTWRRLAARMILVDALRVLLSLLPGVLVLLVMDTEPEPMTVGPLAVVAVWGVQGALADALRWATTRYRITETHVERRTGLLIRTHRSIRIDRIRSVDATARPLRRLAGLRRVTIGAGQMNTAMEAALTLDAVTRREAAALRRELTGAREERPAEGPLAVFEWRWVVHHLFGIWSFVTAAGLLWGGYWTAEMVGVDLADRVGSLADWDALGWRWTALAAFVAAAVVGGVGMAVAFFTEHAHFRLERVANDRGPDGRGTVLRTTQGLFRTRETARDESRLRGISLSEPLLWRWLGTADTLVVTTGLSIWGSAAAVLPRGPVDVARRVAAAVIGAPALSAPLRRHPPAALRRRLLWAALVAGACALLSAPAGRDWWVPVLAVTLPLALGLAVAGYLSLGHAVAGEYLVVRAGSLTRVTSALRRQAVSGIRVRQSLLQRRLGLATVYACTAAGEGAYTAYDLSAGEAAALAQVTLGKTVEPFVVAT
ncbi:PH domain-containing protein [Streptomyces sp. SBT349]|uniref:PH domain-containing protein n=1 Tax=Streptomyces sp. SBT349 TaxID=1580539 RepID=UPI00066B29A2|nr:PH domain-containing protein [Streptomyces sp. SBT349]